MTDSATAKQTTTARQADDDACTGLFERNDRDGSLADFDGRSSLKALEPVGFT